MSLHRDMLSRENLNRLDMLQWVSERNHHIPVTDLAFMLDITEDTFINDMLLATCAHDDD